MPHGDGPCIICLIHDAKKVPLEVEGFGHYQRTSVQSSGWFQICQVFENPLLLCSSTSMPQSWNETVWSPNLLEDMFNNESLTAMAVDIVLK